VPLHAFVRFDPLPGKEKQLRDELQALMEPTRAELGCIRIHLFEALREPLVYCIHSEWVDEAAFNAHRDLPHIVRFLGLLPELVGHPVHAVRTNQIA
jgi:quinol monooxygenase YgiN